MDTDFQYRLPEIWSAMLRFLEHQLPENLLKRWVEPFKLVKIEPTANGYECTLEAPNVFALGWTRDRYTLAIEESFAQVLGGQSKVVYTHSDKTPDLGIFSKDMDSPTASSVSVSPTSPKGSYDLMPDPRFTFDQYIVGASNHFTHASAISVAENPGNAYNPLFIYSSPGLGKTHLLHAIGNYVLAQNPNRRVAYVSAERFLNEMVDALKSQKMSQFRMKFRDSYDVLLIDDIQFIAGKKGTEEEFFHTFNALYTSKRQMVVSSDRPPKEIEDLEERIRTRFESGLVADIQAPEIETRIAILRSKAERLDIFLPDEVATYIATHIKSNVRELEGILIRIVAQASITGAEISLETAKQELKTLVHEESTAFTVEMIQEATAKHFQIKPGELKASSKMKTVTLARHIAIYLSRKYTNLCLNDIGKHFGGRDHTSILHAIKKIEANVQGPTDVRKAVEQIQNQL